MAAGVASVALIAGCAGPAGGPSAPGAAVAPEGDSRVEMAAWNAGVPYQVDPGTVLPDGSTTPSAPDGVGAGDAVGAADAAPEGDGADDGQVVHGSFGLRYVGRRTDSASDNDIYGLLEARVGNEKTDEVTGYVLARASWDIDGNQGEPPFGSLSDSYDGPVNTRLYEAYADFHEDGFSLLRLGRQQLDDTPEYVRFDGVSAETAPDGSLRQQFGAFLGRPNHEYESSGSGDKAVGAWFRAKPWQGARLRIDAQRLEDETQFGGTNNNLYAIRLGQQLGRETHVEGRYSALEDKPRDLDFRATWTRPENGWLVNFWYHELINEQSFVVNEVDPFYETLTTYYPFRQGRLQASKSFDAGYDLTGGTDYRRLKDTADEGEYNHDFTRYFFTGTVHDFLVHDLAMSLTGERWDGNGSDYSTWGVDFTQKWNSAVRTSFGSFYALYKNNFLLDSESQDVRTYYLTLKYLVDKTLSWSLGVDHEVSSDLDDFDTLTAKATWRF